MYEQTLEIEHRLNDLLQLMQRGRYSTPTLASLLKVSIPTVSRGIRALRDRQHRIRSKRLDDGSWCYVVEESSPSVRPSHARSAFKTARAQGRVGT